MIEIHTKHWRGDHQLQDDEPPHEPSDVSLGCRVFIDGIEVENVIRARTRHDAEFAITVITLAQPVKVINHTGVSWKALDGSH